MYPFISQLIEKKAESIADYFFDKTIELAIIVAERRRKLACWRKIKFAAVIRLTNEERIRSGKRPRRMPVWRRRLRIATAECEANCKTDEKFMTVHVAGNMQLAQLDELDKLAKRLYST